MRAGLVIFPGEGLFFHSNKQNYQERCHCSVKSVLKNIGTIYKLTNVERLVVGLKESVHVKNQEGVINQNVILNLNLGPKIKLFDWKSPVLEWGMNKFQ